MKELVAYIDARNSEKNVFFHNNRVSLLFNSFSQLKNTVQVTIHIKTPLCQVYWVFKMEMPIFYL